MSRSSPSALSFPEFRHDDAFAGDVAVQGIPRRIGNRGDAEDAGDADRTVDAPVPVPLDVPGGASASAASPHEPTAATTFAVTSLAPLFRLLGDPSRLGIVFVCLHDAVCVSEIARATGLSSSLVSHHLRLLRGARVVRGARRGKQMFYTAADEHVRRMIVDMREHVLECRQDA